MGDGMMMGTQQIRRQPAWFMLASEFGESTLNEKGTGEFDPTFPMIWRNRRIGWISDGRVRAGI